MSTRQTSRRAGVLLVVVGIFGAPASATSIFYDAVNSGIPNPNTYTFTYFLEDRSFAPGEGFEIFFDATIFEVTSSPTFSVLSVPSSDWSAFTLFAFPPIFPEGSFSAMWTGALSTPLINGPFVVQVDFLGPTVPGGQRFEIVDFNSLGGSTNGWGLLEAGVTQIPESATLSLTLLGLGVLGLLSRKRVRHPPSDGREKQ